MRNNTSCRLTDTKDYFSGAKVTSQVATTGAKSAVYDCLIYKGKSSPYSITERRVPELILVLGSQPERDVSHKPGVGCHYFPPGLQLPSQPLRGLLPILLFGEQRHDGCEQFA